MKLRRLNRHVWEVIKFALTVVGAGLFAWGFTEIYASGAKWYRLQQDPPRIEHIVVPAE